MKAAVRGRPYFSALHPVAVPARRRCLQLHPHRCSGRTACGECFEHAIRADERAVALFDLPREIEPEPDYIDEIAVERAISGERVPLTAAEVAVVIDRLAGRGWSRERIRALLGIGRYRITASHAVTGEIAGVAA